mmetsp:Transcript_59058/g.127769  ORF Transcript_59058/g.127769 Transcript_59058/m.127769 type:complete len:649 (-) Transcript_59058:109-2055(-)
MALLRAAGKSESEGSDGHDAAGPYQSAGLTPEASARLKDQVMDLLVGHQAAVLEFVEGQNRHIFTVWESLLETAMCRPDELHTVQEGTNQISEQEEAEEIPTVSGRSCVDEPTVNDFLKDNTSSHKASPISSKNFYGSSAAQALFHLGHLGESNVDRMTGAVSDHAVGAKLYRLPNSDDGNNTIDLVIGLIILVNVVFTVFHLEWTGHVLAVDLGFKRNTVDAAKRELFYLVGEHIFNAIFIVELSVRICLQRSRYVRDCSNWFDVFLVIGSSFALYMPSTSEYAGNLAVLRTFRLFKTVRAFRTARLLRFIRGFRSLVKTVLSGLQTLGWSLLLLFLVILVCGLAMCELVQMEIGDRNNDVDTREWMWNYYGSAMRATYTMFEILNAGSWPAVVRPLFDKVSWWYVIFILLYVTFVVFAMKTIISALFLKDTLSAASQDLEEVIAETMKKKEAYMNKLRAFFETADTSGDGALSREEFETILANPKVTSWLQILDLEVAESGTLFDLLAQDTGQVTIDQFMQGIARLKGMSRSIDTITIQRDMVRLQAETSEMAQILRCMSATRLLPFTASMDSPRRRAAWPSECSDTSGKFLWRTSAHSRASSVIRDQWTGWTAAPEQPPPSVACIMPKLLCSSENSPYAETPLLQ